MCVWRMILRRKKSAIISWHGMFDDYIFFFIYRWRESRFSVIITHCSDHAPVSFKANRSWLIGYCWSGCFGKIWAVTWQNQQNEYAPSEDSDQPGHQPSLIRVFAVCMKKSWVLSYPLSTQRRLWSDWADAQADLSLRWSYSHFVGFVMSRLNYSCCIFFLFFF